MKTFDVKLFNMTPASLRKKLKTIKSLASVTEELDPTQQLVKMCETLISGLPSKGTLISVDIRSNSETTCWYVTMSWQTLDVPEKEQERYEW